MTREIDDVDDRPRRRKKKKKQPQVNTRLMIYFVIAGSAVVLLFTIAMVVAGLIMLRPAKIVAPTEFAMYNSPEEVFHVELPKGWKQEDGGVLHAYYVTSKQGSASISAGENNVSSIIGDGLRANEDPNAADERLAVSQLHVLKTKQFEQEYGKYEEEPAVTIKTGFGKARRSKFTGLVGGLRRVRGYRLTALGSRTQITVVCICSPSDWDTLEPAFSRVTQSVGSGSRQQK